MAVSMKSLRKSLQIDTSSVIEAQAPEVVGNSTITLAERQELARLYSDYKITPESFHDVVVNRAIRRAHLDRPDQMANPSPKRMANRALAGELKASGITPKGDAWERAKEENYLW